MMMSRVGRIFPFTFLLATAFGLVGFESKSKQTLHLSVISKDLSTAHYSRIRGEEVDLVVSQTLPETVISTLEFTLKSNQSLFFAEMSVQDERFFKNEIFRLGRNVFFLDDSLSHHHFESEKIHIRLIQTLREHSTLKDPGKLLNNLVSDPFSGFAPIQIDEAMLRSKLANLSGASAVEIEGNTVHISNRSSSSNKALARAYLRAEYEAIGFDVSEHRYSSTGINFIAEKRSEGSGADSVLLVSSHMDTVRVPGADDDGSGTITAFAVADALKNFSFEHTLRIVHFDEEELGLVGSTEYARYLSDQNELQNVIGVINLEMTAYDSDNDGSYHVIDCNENTSANLTSRFEQAIALGNIELLKRPACTNRSDHASFWEYGVPAVVISQHFFPEYNADSNPCYHRSCDSIDRLNFGYMEKLTRALAATVRDLLIPM